MKPLLRDNLCTFIVTMFVLVVSLGRCSHLSTKFEATIEACESNENLSVTYFEKDRCVWAWSCKGEIPRECKKYPSGRD